MRCDRAALSPNEDGPIQVAAVMTVATIVASLLPIMWNHRQGVKPLATPIIGGMISSLIPILSVTPEIFFWLRKGELRLRTVPANQPVARAMPPSSDADKEHP